MTPDTADEMLFTPVTADEMPATVLMLLTLVATVLIFVWFDDVGMVSCHAEPL